jgi:DNA-binding NtrC family response regulator
VLHIKLKTAVGDEALAAMHPTISVLVTAECAAGVEQLARQIHGASARAASPFTLVAAAGLSGDATMLTQTCRTLLDITDGGSLLITDVERMPAFAQSCVIETFAGLQSALDPACRMRLMAGTTTVLHDRIAAGTFSERLFYRLNTIHVVGGAGAKRQADTCNSEQRS